MLWTVPYEICNVGCAAAGTHEQQREGSPGEDAVDEAFAAAGSLVNDLVPDSADQVLTSVTLHHTSLGSTSVLMLCDVQFHNSA